MSEFQNTEKGYAENESYQDVNPYVEPRFDGTSEQKQHDGFDTYGQQSQAYPYGQQQSQSYPYGQSYYDPQVYSRQDYAAPQSTQGYPFSQGYMLQPQPKKSANICSIVGFIFGLPAFLGYLFYGVLLFGPVQGSQLMAAIDNSASALSSILAVVFAPFMTIGPLPAFVLGIVSVCLSRNPLQFKRERARIFGILSIVFAVLSFIMFVLFVVMVVNGLNQVYSQYS